jgi:hypothetical protein
VTAVHSANLLQLSQLDEQQAAAWQQQWQQHQQQLSQTCVWNIMMRVSDKAADSAPCRHVYW